ncbi:hypothetical protein DID78_07205, partial [Candidatus Marinamargulisbacteria bacterium SCGC AG-343-D04]
GMLYRLEDGSIRKPHPELIRKIAKPLGLDYDALLKQCGVVVTIHQKVGNADTVPIVDMITLFDQEPIMKKNRNVLSQIKGDYAMECICDSMVPVCGKGDFFIIKRATKVLSNGMYLIEKEKKAQLIITKKDNGSNKSKAYSFPHFFTPIKFNKEQQPMYQIMAVISSSMIQYDTDC